MEYNLSKHSVSNLNCFLDTVNEQIVDVDITLPDYCPDVEKILKCTLKPKIYTKRISSGQLTIDGVSCVHILYCDGIKHSIRAFEQSVPFTATFSLKSTPEHYITLAHTKCEYINCRALSNRKLVVHGAFSLYAKVLSKSTNDVYSFDEECDLQVKHREIEVSDLCALCDEQFSVTEEITLSSKPHVEAMLDYSVDSNIVEVKSIENKIMLNAELRLDVMYISDLEKCTVEHISYVFPFNRVFDCDGVGDDLSCFGTLDVLAHDLHLKNDSLSETSAFVLDVKLNFAQQGYMCKNMKVIEDAYSTCYSVAPEKEMMRTEKNLEVLHYTHFAKESISTDGVKISKVLNIYCENIFLTPVMSDGVLSLSGKAIICILLFSEDDAPVYLERTIELDLKPEISRTFDKAELFMCSVNSLSFRLVDDYNIEIKAEVKADIVLCDMIVENIVTNIKVLSDDNIEKDDCALVLYFAEKGESVWDISKKYLTSETALVRENSLSDDVLSSPLMLLIPTE